MCFRNEQNNNVEVFNSICLVVQDLCVLCRTGGQAVPEDA